jgi:hypothetical protein
MQLHCKSCGKLVRAEDVNIDQAIAKCLACHAVFSFLDQVRGAGAPPRAPVPMPARMRVDNWGSELTITWRWYTHAVWLLLAFCIFWDGFLFVWYAAGIGMLTAGKGDGMIWVMLLFPVLHVLVGIGLTYAVICMFINKTVVRVSMGELTVRHGPLPGPGNRRVFTHELKQLYCTEKLQRHKNSTSITYELQAQLKDGQKLTLLTGLDQLDQALYVEQQVEQHLRIPDERMPGEIRF